MRMTAFLVFAFVVAFSSLYVSAGGSRELAGGLRVARSEPIVITTRCLKRKAPHMETALACVKTKRKSRAA